MTDEWQIERDLEGSSCGLIDVLSWHLCGGTKENHENLSRVVSVPAEIQTEYRLNTSLQQ
jgi:hypothetical protein